jgi:protein arginine N-methyltransferase 3
MSTTTTTLPIAGHALPNVEMASSQSGSSEASDVLDLRDDEGWDDVEPEEEEEQNFISLLDDEVFHDIQSMLEHCKTKYSFDFLEIRQQVTCVYTLSNQASSNLSRSDFYDNVRLVNFIRSRVHSMYTYLCRGKSLSRLTPR